MGLDVAEELLDGVGLRMLADVWWLDDEDGSRVKADLNLDHGHVVDCRPGQAGRFFGVDRVPES